MNQEQAVHHTTLISGYHVSAAKNNVSSEKPKELNCICFQSSLILHNTLEWKSNSNFKCSSKSFKAIISILMMLQTLH